MIDEKTYKRELVRMWDTLRGDEYKIYNSCNGVSCSKCPLNGIGCSEPLSSYEVVEIVKKWSKEHPQKHKVSQTEFEILRSLYKYNSNLVQFGDFRFLLDMIEKGYFDGANGSTYINTYIDLCEVEEK